MFASFREMKGRGQLMMGLFIILLCSFAGMLLGFILKVPFMGMQSLASGVVDLNDPNYVMYLRINQLVSSLLMFGGSAFVMAYFYAKKPLEYLSLIPYPKWQIIGLSLLAYFLLMPTVNISGILNQQLSLPASMASVELRMRELEDFAQEVIMSFAHDTSLPIVSLNLIIIAVVPAFVEEVLFRGALQRVLLKMTRNYHWAVWIGGFIFSFIHFQFFGFLPRMLMGVVFGYIVVYTGSLWTTIAIHFVNNAMALYLQFYYKGEDSVLPDSITGTATSFDSLSVTYWVFAVLGFVLAMLVIKKLRQQSQTDIYRTDF